MTDSPDDIYEFLRVQGDHEAQGRIRRLMDSGRASQTAPGAHAVAEMAGLAIPHVLDYVKIPKTGPTGTTRKAVSKIIKEFGVEKAVALTTRVALDLCASSPSADPLSLGKVRGTIAREWMLEQDYVIFQSDMGIATDWDAFKKRKRSKRYLTMRSKAMKTSGVSLGCPWSREDVLAAVAVVLHFVVEKSGIFVSKQTRLRTPPGHKPKRQYTLQVTDYFLDWLDHCNEHIRALTPLRGPIDHPPLDWDEDGVGGFKPGQPVQIHLFGKRHAGYKVKFNGRECPEVLRALNTIQRTPWSVNQRVAEVFDIAYRKEWTDTGFVFRVHPNPEYCEEPYESEAHATYRREKRRHFVSEMQYRASKLRAGRIRYMAQVYSEIPRFYFVHMLDFRGRTYPASSFFHYQGCDLERGLLQFADAKRIGSAEALRWFLVHGANRFGFDKVPLEDRAEWCNENHSKIMAVGEDPVANRWWLDADNPWQFLAWCLEYEEMRSLPNPLDYESRLPIAMDGSNNGLQIYSLLFRDEVGGFATNCMPCGEPQDAYQMVADRVTESLRDIRDNPTDAKLERWAREILRLLERMGLKNLPRAAVKRAVMTQPYGCTRFTCQRYVIDWYFEWVRDLDLTREEHPFSQKETYNVFRWLGDIVWDAISDTIVKAREAMDWLRGVAEAYNQSGKQMRWSTPLGFEVAQEYHKDDHKVVRMRVGNGVRIKVDCYERNEERIDNARARNGSCPNFVHSLDATAMWETVNQASADGVTHYQMIHDSFGTHAADAPTLAKALRDAYVDIFSQPIIDRAFRRWQDDLPGVALPEPPSRGSLDIQELKNAEYFFA